MKSRKGEGKDAKGKEECKSFSEDEHDPASPSHVEESSAHAGVTERGQSLAFSATATVLCKVMRVTTACAAKIYI